MVGDSEVRIAAFSNSLGHLRQRIHSIRGVSVGVQYAAKILKFNEARQFTPLRESDFIAPLAKLRGDKRQA